MPLCVNYRTGVAPRKAPIVIDTARRLAVLGSPISHSKSPAIHAAAYRVLDVDWTYSAIEVRSGGLEAFLAGLDQSWRGLSLTMPLKREVLSFVDEQDAVSALVGTANTVLFDGERVRGFNTDVFGAEKMLYEVVPSGIARAVLLGAGATACSLAVALVNLGAQQLVVSTRSPAKGDELQRIARTLGVEVVVGDLGIDVGSPDLVVNTVPGTAGLAREFSEKIRAEVPLVDIAYDPWPTPIAEHWLSTGGTVSNCGLTMLVHQALAQIRIFVSGDPTKPLRNEPGVLATMAKAVIAPA